MVRPAFRLPALVFVVGLLGWVVFRAAGYDLDGDRSPDSIRVGGLNLHLFSTRADRDPTPPLASHVPAGRLYNAPADYVHVLVQKAFQWNRRWDVLAWDGPSRVAEISRREDRARASVRVGKWRGWALVRVSIEGRGPETPHEGALVDEVFQCLENLLFQGIPKPRTVRGFSPPDYGRLPEAIPIP